MKEKIVLSELQAKQQAKNGIECKHCGCCDLRVYHTDSSRRSMVVRYRKCRNCGATCTTVERVIGK